MNSIIDYSLVGLILVLSLGYAVTALGPKGLRPRLWAGVGRLLARLPAFLGLKRLSQRLALASAVKPAGACGGCDNCGSAETAERGAPAPSAPKQGPASEVRVPVAKIGWRA
jgi:hypothetical protein